MTVCPSHGEGHRFNPCSAHQPSLAPRATARQASALVAKCCRPRSPQGEGGPVSPFFRQLRLGKPAVPQIWRRHAAPKLEERRRAVSSRAGAMPPDKKFSGAELDATLQPLRASSWHTALGEMSRRDVSDWNGAPAAALSWRLAAIRERTLNAEEHRHQALSPERQIACPKRSNDPGRPELSSLVAASRRLGDEDQIRASGMRRRSDGLSGCFTDEVTFEEN